MAHAKLSPSSAYRWLACPGSIREINKVYTPEKPSVYAQEGTAAHELAERCLKQYASPAKFMGETIVNEDGSEFLVDIDMAEAVTKYIEFADEVAPLGEVTGGHTLRYIEQKLIACDECWGTGDFIALQRQTERLIVADYKHGKGVVVSPDSAQPKIYGIGAINKLAKLGHSIRVVDLVIVQPRAACEAVRKHSMSAADLVDWKDKVLLPGIAATKKADAPLCVGDHCGFCPAISTCPEQRKEALALARAEFSDIEDGTLTFPEPDTLNMEQLVAVAGAAERFQKWANACKALLQQKAEMGTTIPGMKLVQKRAVRQWIDEEMTLMELELSLGEAAYEKKLLSPAKAEKALKAAGYDKDGIASTIDHLVVTPDTGVNLVPESDRRRAVVPAQVEMFVDHMDLLQ